MSQCSRADWLAIFVLFLVPVVGITLFWLVHVLPGVIVVAE